MFWDSEYIETQSLSFSFMLPEGKKKMFVKRKSKNNLLGSKALWGSSRGKNEKVGCGQGRGGITIGLGGFSPGRRQCGRAQEERCGMTEGG